MTTGALLYEGKAKKVFATDKPDLVVQYFKDDATAFNAQKRGTIVEKGVINNKVSERLFRLLEQAGVPTHFVERLSDRELLAKKVAIVPVEVVVRNVVAGSLAKRLGLKEGDPIEPAIVEWYYKNDGLGDPLIADEHIRLMKLATVEQMAEIKRLALRRMWSLDPQIRDFIEVAENQYDWNAVDGVPGFGALPAGTDVQALVAQATGRLQQIAQPTLPSVVAEPIPERETSPGCATATGVTPHAGRATTEGHAHEKAPDPTGASVELPSRPRIGAASTSDGEQPQRTFRRRHGGALPEQATSDKNA